MKRSLLKNARSLRSNSTEAENLIWKHIRAKRFSGLKFRRQQVVGRYIVDFICFEKKVVLELDGGQHAMAAAKDEIRDAWLREQGFRILRFWNNEVLCNTEGVLEEIRVACMNPSPCPSPARGEGTRYS